MSRSFLHCDGPLPCPAGTSPYRIKGEFWRQTAGVMLPMPRVVMAVAEARGRDLRELTEKMGRASADAQMSGVYGNLLRAVTPDNFAARFGPTVTYFYDFAPLTGEDLPGGGVRLFRDSVPLCVAEWWTIVTSQFAEAVLTGHGARRVQIDWKIEPAGVDRGVPCGSVSGEVRFTTT